MQTITFLSDLGTVDTTVATSKATLHKLVNEISIVDISHDPLNKDVPCAAYLLSSAYRHFAKGTIHVVLLNIFDAFSPSLLLAVYDGHYFIIPDNSLQAFAFGKARVDLFKCGENSEATVNGWIRQAAAVVNNILSSADISGIYAPCQMSDGILPQVTRRTRNSIDSNILYVDRYGNIVVDFTLTQFEALVGSGPFNICLPGDEEINTISNHYNDVGQGQFLCRFNSSGFLEIAINHSSAAEELALTTDSDANIHYKFITINL